jgi:hypothetical protein
VGVVGITDRRPQHGTALVGDQLLQVWVAIIRRGLKFAAKGGLRVIDENRKIPFALIANEIRPIVGDEFGEQ